MFRSVLVPLDGSRLSEAVLPTVALVAQRSGARVTLLHVVERHAPSTIHGDRHLTGAAEAEAYLREVVGREVLSGVAVSWHVHRREIDDVAHSLADHAEELEADLVVMLAHGPGDFRHRFFGSMAQHVSRQGPAPILLLRPDGEGKAPVSFRRILVPLDGRAEHEAGLSVAASLAGLFSAPVQLLMVVPTRAALSGAEAATGQLLPAATEEVLQQAQEQAVEYLAKRLDLFQQADIEASATVARGEPLAVICEQSARLSADLVVLGTHGLTGMKAFWSGSLGPKLLGSIPASFVLAPAGS